jgi:hypothetical protein
MRRRFWLGRGLVLSSVLAWASPIAHPAPGRAIEGEGAARDAPAGAAPKPDEPPKAIRDSNNTETGLSLPTLRPAGEDRPRAVARVEGMAARGLVLSLDGRGSEGGGLRYLWTQTGGPTVELLEPNQSVCRFTVPPTPGVLRFVLVVSNGAGISTARVEVPASLDGESAGASAEGELRADAGDDQIARAGQQVTLNGIRSQPRKGVGYRWIQVEGPEIPVKLEDGHTLTFVAPATGVYRFALVIASDSRISPPSYVSVAVSAPAASPAAPPGAAASPLAVAPPPANRTLRRLASDSLLSVEGGTALADELAAAFEGVAERISLYGTASEPFREIALRLEAILPSDPTRRAAWSDRVFSPLSARLVELARPAGLNLVPAGQSAAPLAVPHREALAEQYRQIAQGFRDVRVAR